MGDKTTNPSSPKSQDPGEWAAKLRSRPISEISGVVAPSGASAGNSRGQQLWIFSVCLDVWRDARGQIQATPLTLRKPMPNEEVKALMASFKPYDVVRVHARFAESAASDGSDALLERFIGKPEDDHDLIRAAEELQKPVTVESVRFGLFTLDRRVNWFQAKTEWCGARIRLSLLVKEAGDVEESIRLAEKVWDSQSEWDRRVRQFAVAKLLPLKNDSWLDDDESPLSAEEFSKRMKLDGVTVRSNGKLEFWFDDGDLFFGHAIRVAATLSDGPTNAGIEG